MALPRPLLGFLGVPRPSAPRGLWVLGLEGSQSPAQPIQRGLNHSFLNRKQQRPQTSPTPNPTRFIAGVQSPSPTAP